MEYVKLGNTGMYVSRICLGCMSYGQATTGVIRWPWTLNESDGRAFIKSALDMGITFYDTANVYSDGESEAVLGRAIRDMASREDMVIATKVCSPVRPGPNGRGLSRKAIMAEVDKSLARIIHECPALLCLSATFRFNAPFMTGTASADQDGHLVYGQFARNF